MVLKIKKNLPTCARYLQEWCYSAMGAGFRLYMVAYIRSFKHSQCRTTSTTPRLLLFISFVVWIINFYPNVLLLVSIIYNHLHTKHGYKENHKAKFIVEAWAFNQVVN